MKRLLIGIGVFFGGGLLGLAVLYAMALSMILVLGALGDLLR